MEKILFKLKIKFFRVIIDEFGDRVFHNLCKLVRGNLSQIKVH